MANILTDGLTFMFDSTTGAFCLPIAATSGEVVGILCGEVGILSNGEVGILSQDEPVVLSFNFKRMMSITPTAIPSDWLTSSMMFLFAPGIADGITMFLKGKRPVQGSIIRANSLIRQALSDAAIPFVKNDVDESDDFWEIPTAVVEAEVRKLNERYGNQSLLLRFMAQVPPDQDPMPSGPVTLH